MSDPYCYPGTNILRNIRNIQDAEELEAFERSLTANRLETLPGDFPITPEGYRAIHRYIFADLYDWAGEYRVVNIARADNLFCLAPYIAQELAKRFKAIQSENNLHGLAAEDFAARAAEHLIELNAIHPFREGNGRTLRAFLFVLARQAGHDIKMERIDGAPWIEASRVSFRTGDTRAMRNIIANAIR
jgi:cell filamentation protein, protein adenylyltransferase